MISSTILLAYKYLEDYAAWNAEFAKAIEIYDLQGINKMEFNMVNLLKYDLNVKMKT